MSQISLEKTSLLKRKVAQNWWVSAFTQILTKKFLKNLKNLATCQILRKFEVKTLEILKIWNSSPDTRNCRLRIISVNLYKGRSKNV